MTTINVRVPATTANLGPGFDCLALALDLWNDASFEIGGKSLKVEIESEGADSLPTDKHNLIVQAMSAALKAGDGKLPKGLTIHCQNRIPLSSGLGSSSAAVLAGLLAANALLEQPLRTEQLLAIGADLEGHVDNLAAALYGGLVLVVEGEGSYTVRQLECAALQAVVVLPEVEISTQAARKALPKQVPLSDAVFNIGRALLVAAALRSGDIPALSEAMQDRLHQPYRLPLIPGAAEAIKAAREAGAAAALSGAGPGVIAFVEPGREKAVTEALRAPFAKQGIGTRNYLFEMSSRGAQVESS